MNTRDLLKVLCITTAMTSGLSPLQACFADAAALTPNDNLLPWIARVQVPPGIKPEQLRRGVRVEVPGDQLAPTQYHVVNGLNHQPAIRVYSTGIRYFAPKREKYHFWIQDMSNGNTRAVATNSR